MVCPGRVFSTGDTAGTGQGDSMILNRPLPCLEDPAEPPLAEPCEGVPLAQPVLEGLLLTQLCGVTPFTLAAKQLTGFPCPETPRPGKGPEA